MRKINKRIEWIDQVKGLSIFLVVYGHNFPFLEKYIYTFHVPLFFIISGFFHPLLQNSHSILNRFKSIMIPYFLWSFLLYLFWFVIGRFYGESVNYKLSTVKNVLGIFYGQGGREFMDWGIPMWFLPAIFLCFIFFYYIREIKKIQLQLITLGIAIVVGFLLPYIFNIHFLWSFDVALVALAFYGFGFFFKNYLINLNKKQSWGLVLLFGVVHFTLFSLNSKVDMYRSIYGNEFLFVINGFSGTLFYLMLIKNVPIFKFLRYMGKSTIPILALHLRVLTVIKLLLLIVFGMTIFNFTEAQKVAVSIVQITMLIPIIFIIDKYIPILNGKIKKV